MSFKCDKCIIDAVCIQGCFDVINYFDNLIFTDISDEERNCIFNTTIRQKRIKFYINNYLIDSHKRMTVIDKHLEFLLSKEKNNE